MSVDPALDQLSRDELIVKARALGAKRPEVMTRVELRDEIVRLSETDPHVRKRTRGWLGVARDLVASVVDSGLNLPGAAAAIRGDAKPTHDWQGPPPVATLTLAEIYLAQGHRDRALSVLSEVLSVEPDHAAALALRARILGGVVSAPTDNKVIVSAPVDDKVVTSAPVDDHVAASAPVEDNVVANAPVENNVVARPPAEHEVVATAPVEEKAEPTPPLEEDTNPSGRIDDQTRTITPPSDDANPFPDEPSPVTGERSVFSGPSSVREEPTVRGRVDLFPERAACALVAGERGVEALYELPLSLPANVLRVVWFSAERASVERGELDLPVEPGYHRVVVEGPKADAEVRAALGVVAEGEFSPVAVAWVYQPSAAGPIAKFTPPGIEPPTLRARVDARVVALR
jgi:hypothetical protein